MWSVLLTFSSSMVLHVVRLSTYEYCKKTVAYVVSVSKVWIPSSGPWTTSALSFPDSACAVVLVAVGQLFVRTRCRGACFGLRRWASAGVECCAGTWPTKSRLQGGGCRQCSWKEKEQNQKSLVTLVKLLCMMVHWMFTNLWKHCSHRQRKPLLTLLQRRPSLPPLLPHCLLLICVHVLFLLTWFHPLIL